MLHARQVLLTVAVLAGACGRIGFDPASVDPDDASVDASADAFVFGPACPSDPSLLACWDFDGDLVDRTGRGNDLLGSDIAFVPGVEGDALEMIDTSRADLAAVNIASGILTVEAWVRSVPRVPTQLVFDHNSRWSFSITEAGELRCGANGVPAVLGTFVATGSWIHVACTVGDGAYRAYVDGVEVGATITAAMLMASNTEAAVGGDAPPGTGNSPFVGAVDRFRIWSRALTSVEICEAARCTP
jgi:hypothetical protein